MNINEYKNKAIDWIREHEKEVKMIKTGVKIGFWCLFVGAAYGMAKGAEIESGHVSELIAKIPDQSFHLPTGEQEISDWFAGIGNEDFETVQKLVHAIEDRFV